MLSNKPGATKNTRNRWVIPALTLLFFGPLAAAWLVYFSNEDWRPAESVNFGRLLTPPLSLMSADASPVVDGEPGTAIFAGMWSLVYVADTNCDAGCMKVLDKARRVHLALQDKALRVQRVVLVTGETSAGQIAGPEIEGARIVQLSGGDGQRLLMQFANATATATPAPGQVYLVDPLSNLLMVYEPEFAMKGMLADLKRVLKLSRIG